MAAGKDDGQGPPGSGRPTPIWRLPAAQSTDASDASDTSDSPDREADRRTSRRVPQPVVWGLVAALVCVGLYAAWSDGRFRHLGHQRRSRMLLRHPPRRRPVPPNSPAPVSRAGGDGVRLSSRRRRERCHSSLAEDDGANEVPEAELSGGRGSRSSLPRSSRRGSIFGGRSERSIVAPQDSEPDPPAPATPEHRHRRRSMLRRHPRRSQTTVRRR